MPHDAELTRVSGHLTGPPGTGKTTFLSRQIAIDAERYGREAIMVASLTRAAAAEIAGRDLDIPREQVGTLHAHCYRALGRPVIAESRLAEWNESGTRYPLAGGKAADPDEPGWEPAVGGTDEVDRLFGQYQLLRARMRPRAGWPVDVMAFAREWEAWKDAHRYMDFTDLIEIAGVDIRTAPGNPAVLMIDEAQDHDALEMALVRQWGAQTERLYVVGDPDQAIMTFRGADPHVFQSPALPPAQVRVLSQSHRVPRAVHAHAVRWIEQTVGRTPVDYRPRDAEGTVRRLPGATWKHPEPLIGDMEREIAKGRTCMVLAACSYMLAPLLAVLRREGVPFHNPYRVRRGDWNPLRPAGRGKASTVDRVLAYLRPQGAVWGEGARLWNPADLRDWTALLRVEHLQRGARARLEAHTGREEIALDALMAYLPAAAIAAALDGDLAWLERAALAAKRTALAFPCQVARRNGAALREPPRVIVGTGHSVKGGEADVCYVFPDLSRAGMEEWLRPGEGRDAVRRLFYVMMTRARESLVLCGPAGRMAVSP